TCHQYNRLFLRFTQAAEGTFHNFRHCRVNVHGPSYGNKAFVVGNHRVDDFLARASKLEKLILSVFFIG
ncbi:MAG: hypothetical protein QHH17_04160, partial [Candidatus Bathyarchaeota archaeon]|nr:hypothetical protein [Candidatus Bathyarchaeota archaeon]